MDIIDFYAYKMSTVLNRHYLYLLWAQFESDFFTSLNICSN